MNSNQPISLQGMVPLFVSTYQASSTAQINDAFNLLFSTAKLNPVQFIRNCQKILEAQSNNHHLCQSVSNFIKFISKVMIDNKYISNTGPKDFINKIENIFDNDKISLQYKQNIALSYIKAAFHFQINLQKIIGRVSFLYNTKQIQKAVLLSRAYLASQSKLDAKTQNFYYNKVLKLEINNLSQQILALRFVVQGKKEQNSQMAHKKIKNIHELLKNVHSALVFIAFEKFESSIYKCLQAKEMINIVNSLQMFRQNNKILILLREVIQKIVESIFRMRRMQKLPDLMKAISENLHVEWKKFQSNLKNRSSLICTGINQASSSELEEQLSALRLVNSGLNCRIILILDDSFDILNILVHPLFEIRTQIFQKNDNGFKESMLLFEDTCFAMQSECLEVEFNRFVKALLVNYEIISSKLYLTLDEVLFNNYNFEDFLLNNQNTVILLFSFLAFQTSYFMTNTALMSKLEIFLRKYQNSLFDDQNIQLYFHSLLIVFNYLDDIFSQQLNTQIFQFITNNFIKNRIQISQGTIHNLLIGQFEKRILKNFYQRRYSDEEVSKQVTLNLIQYSLLIQHLNNTFDQEALSIYIEVIKNYSIQDKITLDIFDQVFDSIRQIITNNKVSSDDSHEKIRIFTKFLQTFFDLNVYKHLFESTLSRILPIFEALISCGDLFMDEFFSIIKNAVNHLEYVPQNYYSWMSNLFTPQRLQNQQSFYSLISVLKHASTSQQYKERKYQIFVNFTALSLIETIYKSVDVDFSTQQAINFSQLSSQMLGKKQFFTKSANSGFSKRQLMSLVSLHQLIYYHSGYLTRRTLEKIITFSATKLQIPEQGQRSQEHGHINSSQFSFVRGKYQLVFILLFRRRLTDVNQILSKLNIDKKVYNAVYIRDFNYLIQYDTPILIKQQAQILKNLIITDKLQMACANTSFLVIFYKFTILFQINTQNSQPQNQYSYLDNSDSDEEDFEPMTQFKTNFKQVKNLIRDLPLPQEWSQVNELNEIKQFIQMVRSNESGREWLNLLISNCMTKNQMKVMEYLMKDLERVNGTYRHIKKVNKTAFLSSNHEHKI